MRKLLWSAFAVTLASLTIGSCSDRDSQPSSPDLSAPTADLEVIEPPSERGEMESAWRIGPGHLWGDHNHPWDYFLENSFDAFYEYKLTGRGRLIGFRYVTFVSGDTATIGTNFVGWLVHAIPGEAHWDSLASTWVVRHGDAPRLRIYRHFRPIGNIEEARHMESAPGFFMLHIARARFYYGPESRWVRPGIDWHFEHNYEVR